MNVSHVLQPGHWIQDCPTNNDRDYDNRPRIKRTTGIPRSFLKAVENPSTGQIGHGVMVTPEGGYVVAQPDVYVVASCVLLTTDYPPSAHRGRSKCTSLRDSVRLKSGSARHRMPH